MSPQDSILTRVDQVVEPLAKTAADEMHQHLVAGTIAELTRPDELAHISLDEWETFYKPAMLWHFFRHLSSVLSQSADSWNHVFFSALQTTHNQET